MAWSIPERCSGKQQVLANVLRLDEHARIRGTQRVVSVDGREAPAARDAVDVVRAREDAHAAELGHRIVQRAHLRRRQQVDVGVREGEHLHRVAERQLLQILKHLPSRMEVLVEREAIAAQILALHAHAVVRGATEELAADLGDGIDTTNGNEDWLLAHGGVVSEQLGGSKQPESRRASTSIAWLLKVCSPGMKTS